MQMSYGRKQIHSYEDLKEDLKGLRTEKRGTLIRVEDIVI